MKGTAICTELPYRTVNELSVAGIYERLEELSIFVTSRGNYVTRTFLFKLSLSRTPSILIDITEERGGIKERREISNTIKACRKEILAFYR
jgi:hypothetical protein